MNDIKALAYRIRHACNTLEFEDAHISVELKPDAWLNAWRELQSDNLSPAPFSGCDEFKYMGITFKAGKP